MVCVSGSIIRHLWAGRTFFIPLTAVSARSPMDPVVSLPWRQPSSFSGVTAECFCHTALYIVKWPVLLGASCSHRVQGTEVTGTVLPPQPPPSLSVSQLAVPESIGKPKVMGGPDLRGYGQN